MDNIHTPKSFGFGHWPPLCFFCTLLDQFVSQLGRFWLFAFGLSLCDLTLYCHPHQALMLHVLGSLGVNASTKHWFSLNTLFVPFVFRGSCCFHSFDRTGLRQYAPSLVLVRWLHYTSGFYNVNKAQMTLCLFEYMIVLFVNLVWLLYHVFSKYYQADYKAQTLSS